MVLGFGGQMGGSYTTGNIFGDNQTSPFDSMLNTSSGLVSLLKQIKGLGQDEVLTDEEKYRRNFYKQMLNNSIPQGNQQIMQFPQGNQLPSLMQPQQPMQPYSFNDYGRYF